jgi:fructose-specific phosphotransferase system IIC component
VRAGLAPGVYHPLGNSVTFWGWIVELVDGFIGGYLVAWLYNRFAAVKPPAAEASGGTT